jgi:ABC-type phosphate transport system permease subunit
MAIGILAMVRLDINTPYWELSIYAIMVGAGLGLSMQTIVIALQNAVDFKDMGVATSSNTFFRSLGSVFGTAAFGTILTNRLGHYLLNSGFDPAQADLIQNNTAAIAALSPEGQVSALEAFVSSFHVVFIVAAPVVAIGFIAALFLRETPLRTNADYASARNESAGEALG